MWRCRYMMPWLCSRDLLVGLRLRDCARRLRKRADYSPTRKLNLEGVVAEALGLTHNDIGSPTKCRLACGLADERGLGLSVAPGLVCNAAERKARGIDIASVELKADRDGYQGECVGETIADLEVGVMAGKALGWQLDPRDELVRLDVGVALRRVAW